MRAYKDNGKICYFNNKPLLEFIKKGPNGDGKRPMILNMQYLENETGVAIETIKDWYGRRRDTNGNLVRYSPSNIEIVRKIADALNIDYHKLLYFKEEGHTMNEARQTAQENVDERAIVINICNRLSRLLGRCVELDVSSIISVASEDMLSEDYWKKELEEITEMLRCSAFDLTKDSYDKLYRLLFEVESIIAASRAPGHWCEISPSFAAVCRLGILTDYAELEIPETYKEHAKEWNSDSPEDYQKYTELRNIYNHMAQSDYEYFDDHSMADFVQRIISDTFVEVLRSDFNRFMI